MDPARLRHERFFSLAALNARIAELLEVLNTRPMRLYRASRRELFERLDRPALRPLPAEAFIVGEWHYDARVNIDYHVELHGHYYSVPYPPPRTRRCPPDRDDGRALPSRAAGGGPCPQPSPRPAHHRPRPHAQSASAPPRVDALALHHLGRTIGPQTAALVEAILADRPHPSRATARASGSCVLPNASATPRLEAACARAVAVGARSYRHVDSILKHGLDRLPGPIAPPQLPLMPAHAQIRGREYYQDPDAPEAPARRPRASTPAEGDVQVWVDPRSSLLEAPRPSPAAPDPPNPAPGAHQPPSSRRRTECSTPRPSNSSRPQAAAMATAWTEQQQQADMTALAFDERFALLVDAEWRARENKRLTRALQDAKLKLSQACLEAIDYPARRALDKAVIRQLATCRWVAEHQGVLITGMTGTGKSFLACALAHQACRKGYRAPIAGPPASSTS